jgi:hypothetical protein
MLQPQSVNINFSKGLDTKTDPWQVQVGNFLSLVNSVFTEGGANKKRNGYGLVLQSPETFSSNYLTTLNGNLTAIGASIYAYSAGLDQWVTKGQIAPVELSVLPLIRNNNNQTQCDSVVAFNGLVCAVYTESLNGSTDIDYKYVIADSDTGQNIVEPTLIPVSSGTVTGSPRVFVLGNYFILIFTNVISGTSHLQYVAISVSNPTTVTTNTDIASSYISSTTLSWDGVVAGNNLYVAYNTTTGGQAIKVVYLSNLLALSAAVSFSGTATLISLCADFTGSNLVIYVSFYNSGASTGYTLAVGQTLNTIFNPVEIISSGTILNLSTTAQNGSCSVYYEVSNLYGFDSSINSNYINAITISQAGTVTQTALTNGIVRSVGLASKAFIVEGIEYFLAVQNSPFQTTYFLINASATLSETVASASSLVCSPIIVAKLAYENGGGYLTLGLPCVTVNGSVAQVPYLFKDLIEALATTNDGPNSIQSATGGIYSQTGIQLASFTLGTENIDSVEIAQTLQISGGFGWMYDGYLPVEENFFLWPELAEPSPGNTVTPTADITAGSNLVSSVSSLTGVSVGMTISGIGIPAGQTITSVSSSAGITFGPGYANQTGSSVTVTIQNPAASASLATSSSAITSTGNTTSGSNLLTNLSTTVNVAIGMSVTGTGIPAGQFVTAVEPFLVTFGPGVASGSHTSETITFTGNINVAQLYYYQICYEWQDNNGNIYRSAPSIPVSIFSETGSFNILDVPTLRLTYKIPNPIKVVGYRWSAATQTYYQFTSITQPILNSTEFDYVTLVDAMSDPSQNIAGASILGNNIIYTTGGVLEDVNSPATSILSLFDTRAWKVDAEDPNLLWFSKQIVEGVPVEWSDLLTYYVAPSTGISGAASDLSAAFPMDDKFILFKAQQNSTDVICYINGTGPDSTGQNSNYPTSPIFITSSVSCNNQQSIVLVPDGLMFQAANNKGIWLLSRGLQTSYIGAPVQAFNKSTVTSAVNIPDSTYVLFTLSTGETLMYDYFYGQWGVFLGVPAVSSCIYQSLHTFLNAEGSVYQETPGEYLDGDVPVLRSFTTSWISFALQGYERLIDMYFLAKYLSPHFLNIEIAYDFNPAIVQRTVIRPDNFSSPVASPYGVPTPSGAPYNKEQWRIHAKKQLCESFQISVSEIFDPSQGVPAGEGFTMSGIKANIMVKQSKRPIAGKYQAG